MTEEYNMPMDNGGKDIPQPSEEEAGGIPSSGDEVNLSSDPAEAEERNVDQGEPALDDEETPEEKIKMDARVEAFVSKDSTAGQKGEMAKQIGIPKEELRGVLAALNESPEMVEEIVNNYPEDEVLENIDEEGNPVELEADEIAVQNESTDILKEGKDLKDKFERGEDITQDLEAYDEKVKKHHKKNDPGKLRKALFDEETGHLRKGNKGKLAFRLTVYTAGLMALIYLSMLHAMTKGAGARFGKG